MYGEIKIGEDESQAKMQEAVTIGNCSSFKQPKVLAPKIDKQEVSFWKLPDEVGKAEFHHWADSIDVQLEAVHGFEFLDIVLDKVRRSETEINETFLKTISECVKKEWSDKGEGPDWS